MGNYFSMCIFLCCKSVMYKSGSSILLYIEKKKNYHDMKTFDMKLQSCGLRRFTGCPEVIIQGIWGGQLSPAFTKMKFCKSPIKIKFGRLRQLSSTRPQPWIGHHFEMTPKWHLVCTYESYERLHHMPICVIKMHFPDPNKNKTVTNICMITLFSAFG